METTLDIDGYSHTNADYGASFRILIVVTTAQSSQAIELTDGAELTLGRDEPADLVLVDPRVSRLHARLRREGELVRVTDLGSRNGTWLSGQRIEEALVPIGGAVGLGATSVCVQLAQAPRAIELGLMSGANVLAALEQECIRSKAFGRPLTVMMVRPMHRGSIGSAQLSARVLAALRASDRAGLYDRSALLVVLPETDTQAAERIAAQLAHESETTARIACGIASAAQAGHSGENLVSAAWAAVDRTSEQQPTALAPEAKPVHGPCSDPLLRSPSMLELAHMIEKLAPRKISVLILGETGSGKELVARELHNKSDRKRGPLQIVNCAAIPEQLTASVLFGHVRGAFTGALRDQDGMFAQAHGGTIFLDEVGELSAEAQAALLRVLDTRRISPIGGSRELTVDVRVIAATHRNLAAMTEQGSFRLDLYHRLNSVVLRVPPLRDRKQEILPLAQHFLERFAPAHVAMSISDEASEWLLAYDWPGNVRELRNVIERAVALCDDTSIRSCDLPHHLEQACDTARQAPPACTLDTTSEAREASLLMAADSPVVDSTLDLRRLLRQQEISLIEAALRRTEGNQKRAATLLRLPLRTFERKLQVLGIQRGR